MEDCNNKEYIDIPHIGEVLLEEYIKPKGISIELFSEEVGIPLEIIEDIINGEVELTELIDFKLTEYFGLSNKFFLRMEASLNYIKLKCEIG